MASQVIMTRSPFQSTSSVWRTTAVQPADTGCARISIHVLRVEDDGETVAVQQLSAISIHVLRVEDDRFRVGLAGQFSRFQSTSSVWRTTWPIFTPRET